jgi:hypothetical protein
MAGDVDMVAINNAVASANNYMSSVAQTAKTTFIAPVTTAANSAIEGSSTNVTTSLSSREVLLQARKKLLLKTKVSILYINLFITYDYHCYHYYAMCTLFQKKYTTCSTMYPDT